MFRLLMSRTTFLCVQWESSGEDVNRGVVQFKATPFKPRCFVLVLCDKPIFLCIVYKSQVVLCVCVCLFCTLVVFFFSGDLLLRLRLRIRRFFCSVLSCSFLAQRLVSDRSDVLIRPHCTLTCLVATD